MLETAETSVVSKWVLLTVLTCCFLLSDCQKLTPQQKREFISAHGELEHSLVQAAIDHRYINWFQASLFSSKVYLRTENDAAGTELSAPDVRSGFKYYSIPVQSVSYMVIYTSIDRMKSVYHDDPTYFISINGKDAFNIAIAQHQGVIINYGLLPQIAWTASQAKEFVGY